MSTPRRPLPDRPSLEQQRKLAKELLARFRAGDHSAADRVRALLPDKRPIRLADTQFVIAREYGFVGWAALKRWIHSATGTPARPPHDELKRAIDTHDAGAIRSLFEHNAAARGMIDAPLFPFESPAIVHFAGAGDLRMVELLLALGADPNRRSAWWAGGFHALHHASPEVADRLLEAGAIPDACAAAHLDRPELLVRILTEDAARVQERGGDGQTPLHFARSRTVVDLLLERGADIDATDVDHRGTPAQWMLERKRGAGRFALAAYLVERGARADVFLAAALGLAGRLRRLVTSDPSVLDLRTGRGEYGEQPPGSSHIYTWTIGRDLSPLRVASQFDQDAALEVLRAYSSPKERFVAACVDGRADEARQMLRERPTLVGVLDPQDARALPDAGWAGDAAAVELMLSLGFDAGAGGQDGGTVLHCAAWQGRSAAVEAALRYPAVRALIEERDPTHGATPLGWCCHGARHRANPAADYPEVARLLLGAGARPVPGAEDVPDDVMNVIRSFDGRDE